MFLVVGEEMLSTCLHSGALHAHNGFVGAFSIKIGVWAKAGQQVGIIYIIKARNRVSFTFPIHDHLSGYASFQNHQSWVSCVDGDKRTMSSPGPKNTL